MPMARARTTTTPTDSTLFIGLLQPGNATLDGVLRHRPVQALGSGAAQARRAPKGYPASALMPARFDTVSASASRLRPPVTCTSAAPARRSSTGSSPATTGGVFVLRIEDTDVERSSADMVTGILDGLRWLGLDWDEGPGVGGPHAPYFQSERLERYRDRRPRAGNRRPRLLRLRRPGRGAATARPRTMAPTSAPTTARPRSPSRRMRWPRRLAAGEPHAIRFLVPPGETSFADLVHGPVRFDRAHIEDFVVLRSDGHPTYHLSVVVDDIDMAISHVIRGDDHISNTPKQVLLYEAFAAPVPAFAHVPLIMGPDKKRLSKRHGATSVMEYERQGYLPEALVNFLALLGWSPGGDDELLSKDELVAALRARRHQHRQRRVQHREARLVQPPVPGPAHRRRADRHAAAVVRARRTVARRPRRAPRRGVVRRRADAAQAALQAPWRVRGRRPAVPRGAVRLRPRRRRQAPVGAGPARPPRGAAAGRIARAGGASTMPSSSGRCGWWPTRAG